MTQWGVDTLFNPAKRHMDEEKRRLQATRQQVGDTSGGKRIDLESGKVRIGKPGDSEDATADEQEGKTDGAAKDGAAPDRAEKKSAGKPVKPAPSPAAVRAAARRGRQPR